MCKRQALKCCQLPVNSPCSSPPQGGANTFAGATRDPVLPLNRSTRGRNNSAVTRAIRSRQKTTTTTTISPPQYAPPRAEHALHAVGEYEVHRRDHLPPPVIHSPCCVLNEEQPDPAAHGA